MKASIELLFILTSIYQSFGLQHCSLRKLRKYHLPALHNTIVVGDKLPDGFEIDSKVLTRPVKPKQPIPVSSISHLKDLIYQGYRVEDLDVRGDTARNTSDVHPVVQALYRRKEMKVRKPQAKRSPLLPSKLQLTRLLCCKFYVLIVLMILNSYDAIRYDTCYLQV
jgi:hypothetical protein